MKNRSFAILILLVWAVAAGGCGSGSETTSTPEAGGGRVETAPGNGSARHAKQEEADGGKMAADEPGPEEPSFTPKPHHDSGGGSKQFRTQGGDNSIQAFGAEGSGTEFGEAASVLHAYMDARAAGAWRAACERLASPLAGELIRQLGTGEGGAKSECAEVLASVSANLPASLRRETAELDAAALRIEGESAFLLFHSASGEAFFIPMRREDGDWKVAAIAPSPLG